MRDLRGDVRAEPQQEQQDVLARVLERLGLSERREEVEGTFSREELRILREHLHAAESQGDDVLAILREQARMGEQASPWAGGEWPGQPRVEKGVPDRVDRLRALGNAVVPQVAEYVGRRIMAATGATT